MWIKFGAFRAILVIVTLKDTQETASMIAHNRKRRMSLFCRLSTPEQSAVFEKLSAHVQQDIIRRLDTKSIVDLLDNMDPRHAERALTRMENIYRRRQIVARLNNALREKAEYFLRFHPQARIPLLNFNYILLPHTATISDAADEINDHYRSTGKFPEVLVHRRGSLIGEVPLAVLIREHNNHRLEKHTEPLTSVSYKTNVREIADIFKKTRHGKVIVLDRDESVLGIIYSDDALELFEGQPSGALYHFAGVEKTERPLDTISSKVRRRYKWLVVNLGTGFLAAGVVGLFENTIDQIILLAVYMPIIAGMGGNAATQTLAVIVRGIAIGEIHLRNALPVLGKEVGAGFINGILTGSIVALVATLLGQGPMLGVVIGIALVANLVVAGFFGTLIPLIMQRLHKDPALSATVFITTATDVLGFLALLGLATILLL